MELKNIFEMTKTDRYTQDGRDELAKLQETEDVKYKTGDISQKTGLQKQPDGSWAPPKEGGKPAAKKEAGSINRTPERIAKETAIMEALNLSTGEDNNLHKMSDETIERLYARTQEKPAEEKPTQTKIIKFEEAQEAMKNGHVVQWQDRHGEWNDVEPGTSELVMARDIGSKLRIKTDKEGNPVKQKSEPEPSMKEARDKLLELEKRRKKFAPYPDLEEPIRMEQSKYLFKAGFESREDFDNFIKSEGLNDAAPRQLTGDCKIRIRK